MEYSGSHVYLDGLIIPAAAANEPPAGEVTFYEVIRTRDGIPVFFDDHMNRLMNGISTRYQPTEDISEEVRKGLYALADCERHEEINVKVTVSFTGHVHRLHICYIPSSYPSEVMVAEGVPLIFYHAERFEPGVKMLNARLRTSVNEELARRNAYEALLVNRDGLITEGSRSNIFFITHSGTVLTAPDSMVLSGITRHYVTGIIREEGIPLTYKAAGEKEAGFYRSAFITGTSPMVLAVKCIENQYFDVSDPLIVRLREKYSALVDNSVTEYMMRNKTD